MTVVNLFLLGQRILVEANDKNKTYMLFQCEDGCRERIQSFIDQNGYLVSNECKHTFPWVRDSIQLQQVKC